MTKRQVTKGHCTDVSFELGRGVERFVGVEAEKRGKKAWGYMRRFARFQAQMLEISAYKTREFAK